MRWLQVLAVAVSVALPQAAQGQDVQPVLQPGVRVLATIPDDVPQRQRRFRPVQMISGEITRTTRETIYVRPTPRLGELAIPFAAVDRLEVSRGAPSRTSSALITGFQQGIAFAVLGTLLYNEPSRQFGVTRRGEAAALGAGFGFLGGALVGAIAPFERWQRVKVPGRG